MKKHGLQKGLIVFMVILLVLALSACGSKPQQEETQEENVQQDDVQLGGGTESENAQQVDLSVNPSGDPNPVVTIEMESGDQIKVELYPHIAPNTVNSFIALAESGFYDGIIFHRVMEGFMIQGGDPSGNGTGGPGYSIKGEFTANGFINDLKHTRGVISMGRVGGMNDSAGSQFFIVHQDSLFLDGEYASFGKVVEGIEIVDQIAQVETVNPNRPVEDQRMKTVTVETFGITYDEPEKIQ